MDKLDLKQARRELFTAPRGTFVEIDVPPCNFVMIDGHGDPNTAPEYQRALQTLYSGVYALKAELKAVARDFVVAPLEGVWSSADHESFTARRKSEWDWTMMIMVPDYAEPGHFEAARERVRRKLGEAALELRFETLHEGLCLQALHVGSYDDEAELLARLHNEIMPAGGYDFAGRHHEIYLSDPRKTEASKLRTILRQPVRRAG